jgi:uncharacterized protein YwgA
MKQGSQKHKRAPTCTIPADVFRRIYLYTIIGKFNNGVYGAVRLQKTAYISERNEHVVKPFSYKKHHFGEYSEQVDNIREQLISLGFVKALPLSTSLKFTIEFDGKSYDYVTGGNRYIISDTEIYELCKSVISTSYPKLLKSVEQTIDQYGYKKEEDLLKCCYDFDEFKDKKDEDVIFETDLPDWVEISDISDDVCDELTLMFTPSFINFVTMVTDGFERTTIEWEKVKKVVLPL